MRNSPWWSQPTSHHVSSQPERCSKPQPAQTAAQRSTAATRSATINTLQSTLQNLTQPGSWPCCNVSAMPSRTSAPMFSRVTWRTASRRVWPVCTNSSMRSSGALCGNNVAMARVSSAAPALEGVDGTEVKPPGEESLALVLTALGETPPTPAPPAPPRCAREQKLWMADAAESDPETMRATEPVRRSAPGGSVVGAGAVAAMGGVGAGGSGPHGGRRYWRG
mmetsp:Transcript_78733/g.228565  ORF Transcript_78733/g.228565 Transcript_78733/m.228565 type:complete len:222 (-) Transcript_78733:13-678(-)